MTKKSIKPRFNRTSLNLMILVVSVLVIVFSYMGREQKPVEKTEEAPDQMAAVEQPDDLHTLLNQFTETAPTQSSVEIRHWQHDNGATVYFVQAPEIPMLDIRLIFNAGGARDGHLPGLAKFTVSLLGEGTQKHTVDEIADIYERLGAQFRAESYRDMAVIHLRSLTEPKYLDPAIDLTQEILTQSNFPEAAMERIRMLMLLGLEQVKQDPGALLGRKMWEILYEHHPYGIYPSGNPESLTAIAKTDLEAFYQKYFVTGNLTVAVVSDLDEVAVKRLTDRLLAGLPKGQSALPLEQPQALPAQQVHIDFPSQQTHIQLATLGIARDSEDYFPLLVANEVLGGGGFSSILNKAVRQERGYAYSVYSSFTAMQAAGPFVINLQTKNGQAKEAVELVQQLFAQFVEEGPSQAQLEKAKNHLIASYPLQIASNSSIIGQLGNVGFYGLSPDTVSNFPTLIHEVMLDSVRQALKRSLAGDHVLLLTLGPEDPLQ